MKNLGMRIVVRAVVVGIVALGFLGWSYLGIGNTGSLKAVEKIQKAYPELSTYKTGELSLASMYEAYDYSTISLDGVDATAEEKEEFQAMMDIGDVLHQNIPNVEDSKSDGVTGAYLGTESGSDVDGLYVLEFKNPISIDQAMIDSAHQLAEEYYIIKDKIVVIVNAEFLETNNITIEDFSDKVMNIL